MYPIGKGVDHLSLYLKVAGSLPPFGWTKYAYFSLALINHMDEQKSVVRGTCNISCSFHLTFLTLVYHMVMGLKAASIYEKCYYRIRLHIASARLATKLTHLI